MLIGVAVDATDSRLKCPVACTRYNNGRYNKCRYNIEVGITNVGITNEGITNVGMACVGKHILLAET